MSKENKKPGTITIDLYNKSHYHGSIDIEEDSDSLISVFTANAPPDEIIHILHVAGMEYGIVIPKETYDKINGALDLAEEDS